MLIRAFAVPPRDAARAWERRRASFAMGGPEPPRHDVDEMAVPVKDPDAAFARARDALLAYRIYAEDVLVHRIEGDRVRPGSLIVQRVRVGPAALEAGVRVEDVWDAPGSAGFRYVTLDGHPERGVATFSLARKGDTIAFRIESRSGPADLWSRLGSGYARAKQRHAVAGAMARMRSLLEARA